MNLRSGSCLLFATCWIVAVGAAHAEPVRTSSIPLKERQSHIPLPAMPGAPEVTLDSFQKQLDQLALQDLLQKVAKDPEKFGLKDDPELKSLMPKNGVPPNFDPNDPRVQKLIENLRKQYQGRDPSEMPSEGQIPPDVLKSLEELNELQKAKQSIGNPPGTAPQTGGGDPNDPPKENEADSKKPPASVGGETTPDLQKPPESNGSASPEPSLEDKRESETNKVLAKALDTLKDSKSFTQALDALTKPDEEGRDALARLDDSEGFDWDKFNKDTGMERLEKWLPKTDWKWTDAAAKLPSISGPTWETKTSPAFPSTPGGIGTSGSMLTIFLTVLLLAALGFAIWKLRTWFQQDDAQAQGGAWRLGPWPVQPALVRTREELIRAFEYLSLLRLGRPARNWNHRHIAAQLGLVKEAPPDGREAAARLASLYEHARYAPATDPLADSQFEAARRDLSLLAGVPGA